MPNIESPALLLFLVFPGLVSMQVYRMIMPAHRIEWKGAILEGLFLIHLNNGQMVGGFYGPDSYATSFPNHGDIYLEAVYRVDETEPSLNRSSRHKAF